MMAAAHQQSPWIATVEEVLSSQKTSLAQGLSSEEVARRREQYGTNELQKEPGTPLWKLVLSQFDDMLVKILLAAALVSFVLAYLEEGSAEEGIRAYIEPLVILLILVLNAIVGVWQESNAEKALEALKELQSEHAKVLRDGKLIPDLPARELVPGDVVELAAGDKVPADIRLVVCKTATLRAEQASLTGEPQAVLKGTDAVADANCELQSKECMLFAGTAVASGSGIGIVTSIGMATEIGKIQSQIQEASQEEEDTPLKQKLDQFGELLAKVIFWICVTVWLINYHHFLTLRWAPGSLLPDWAASSFNLAKCTYYFKIAVALAVAAIPEGLPAVITTCLALGTRKMAKKNAIVRKLPSVETLGCTTVICSDKTGTLTTNQMSVVQLSLLSADGSSMRHYEVTGTTYNPDQGEVLGLPGGLDTCMSHIAEVCAVCNESKLDCSEGTFTGVGAPTEASLKVLTEKLGTPDKATTHKLVQQRIADAAACASPVCEWYDAKLQRLALLEFDRDRKSMGVVARQTPYTRHSGNVLLVKGAAECVLERCDRIMLPEGKIVKLTPAARAAVLETVDDMAGNALRILALARKTDLPPPLSGFDGDMHGNNAATKLLQDASKYADIESGMVFLGLAGLHNTACQQNSTVSLSPTCFLLLQDASKYADIESGMVFLGLAGLRDPPRPEVADAIRDCTNAGIRVIVITGDNQATAEAICRMIGVFDDNEDLSEHSFTGRQFNEMGEAQQEALLRKKNNLVFSRAEPKHKQDIVRLLKRCGDVAAMTGDGVNDAPALKLADIGVAMGITGTEVAKEASDMVLADDNFSTIVAAVAEGRSIYNNMKAFIRYMISSNIGEVASIFLTAILGLPEGLIPVQLLWVNLVTDGPPATALGFNPADPDIMQKPPRDPEEQLITPWVFVRYMVVGAYVGAATVGAFVVWYMCDSFLGIDLSQDGHTPVSWYQLSHWEACPKWHGFTASSYTAGSTTVSFANPCDYFTVGRTKASTLSLSVLVAIEMFNAYNALSEDNSLLQVRPWSNPWLALATVVSLGLHCVILYVPFLAQVFSIVPLSLNEWLLVLLFALPVILIDELLKMLGRRFFGVKHVVPTKRASQVQAEQQAPKLKAA
ncbi:hypothetical protein OEZ86_009888 [Tetradesmus obliquus]|uniref:Cation-transporting P-type ATPase N-terminal domain-containing protein n=1 Tax=Tetradesmus obliquus TaxID=3088 RepID=A0ABY8UNY0_TETOB|nr:hypothetical protein OEZ85_001325 [Tetradesmus obliquus]WIA43411.1 hypothetical protein OEZ86_009888 [Tetradesmus obliquus]